MQNLKSLAFLTLIAFAAALSVQSQELPLTLDFPLPIGDPTARPVFQSKPAVAAGPGQFFAVWVDHRAGLGPEIWGARIGTDGELLDPHGVLLSDRSTLHYNYDDPVVAWADGVYLVVWERDYFNLEGVRVSASGEILDQAPIPFGEGGGGSTPHLASNGDRFLLAAPGFPLKMKIIDASGEVVATLQHEILASLDAWWFAVTSNGDEFFAISSRRNPPDSLDHDTILLRITADGEASWTPTSLGEHFRFSSMVWHEDHLVLALAPYWSSADPDLKIVRLLPDGSVTSTQSIDSIGALYPVLERIVDGNLRLGWIEPYEQTGATGAMRSATIGHDTITVHDEEVPGVSSLVMAHTGGDLLLAWLRHSGNYRYGTRYAIFDETLADEQPLTTASAAQSEPVAARSAISMLIAWVASPQDTPSRIEVATQPLIPDEPFTGTPLNPSSSDQSSPAAASDGASFLVVWEEGLGGSGEIFAQRVDSAAEPMSEPVRLSTEAVWSTDPAVSWNGRLYIVAFTEARKTVVVRVTAQGDPIDAAPFEVASSPREASQSYPEIDSLPSGVSLLVWQDGEAAGLCRILCPAPPPPARIHGARLDLDGNVIDPMPIEISPGADIELLPAIAANRDNFLVVWQTGSSLGAARVSSAGSVLDRSRPSGQIDFPGLYPARPNVSRFAGSWIVAVGEQEDFVEGSIVAVLVDQSGEIASHRLRLADQIRSGSLALTPISSHVTFLTYVDLTSPDSLWGGTPRLFGKNLISTAPPEPGPRRRGVSRN